MQSLHLYAGRPSGCCKNRGMDATFMQIAPVAASTISVHLYSGRAMTPANTNEPCSVHPLT